MSRTAVAARRVDPAELSELPTIKGKPGAVEFIAETLGVPVTPTMIRTATESRRLRVYKISAHNWYAERDLYEFVLSLGRGGSSEQVR